MEEMIDLDFYFIIYIVYQTFYFLIYDTNKYYNSPRPAKNTLGYSMQFIPETVVLERSGKHIWKLTLTVNEEIMDCVQIRVQERAQDNAMLKSQSIELFVCVNLSKIGNNIFSISYV